MELGRDGNWKGAATKRLNRRAERDTFRPVPTPMRRPRIEASQSMSTPPLPPPPSWSADSGLWKTSSYRSRLQARGQEAMQRSFVVNGIVVPPVPPAPGHAAVMQTPYSTATGSYGGSSNLDYAQPWASPASGRGTPTGSDESIGNSGEYWACLPSQWPMQGTDPSNHSWQMPRAWPPQPQMQPPQPQMQQRDSPANSPMYEMLCTFFPDSANLGPEELAAQLRAAAPEVYDD